MCGSNKLHTIINLGKHPLVNRLVKKEEVKKKDFFFPLILKRCEKCSLVQLSQFVDPKNLYVVCDQGAANLILAISAVLSYNI